MSSGVSFGGSSAIRQLVDLASEFERDFIIVVIHRRARVRPDVESLIPRQEQRHRAVHRRLRNHFAIDLEDASARASDPRCC